MNRHPPTVGRPTVQAPGGPLMAVASGLPAATPTLPQPPKPNDCEIIVIGKGHQRYAEHVEKSLRKLGLKVDLMFPKPDISVHTFIAHIASTGASFAAVIKSDNEAHQSLSLHVLKNVPKPEEHRNMPLDRAFNLIKERYADIRKAEFGIISPEFLKTVELMTTSHFMTDSEYLFLIKYIDSRWQQQKLMEDKQDFDPGLGLASVPQLQKKILQVMGLDGNL